MSVASNDAIRGKKKALLGKTSRAEARAALAEVPVQGEVHPFFLWGPKWAISALNPTKVLIFFLWGPQWTISALNSTKVPICEVHESGSNVATGLGENGGLGATSRHPSCPVFRKMGGGEIVSLKRQEVIGNWQKTHMQIKSAQGIKK